MPSSTPTVNYPDTTDIETGDAPGGKLCWPPTAPALNQSVIVMEQ
jgi:hypothetical protein